MAHLTQMKGEYAALVERLAKGPVGLPEPESQRARAGWREILEILYSPEEAALAARFPIKPTPLPALARRLGKTEADLRDRLEAMCDKGIVMDIVRRGTGEVKYFLAPPVVGFFEFSMMRAGGPIPRDRMASALEAYTRGDATFAREAFGSKTALGRALVHESALGEDVTSDVLGWERASEIVSESRMCAVSTCYCRHKAEHAGRACDTPQETCLSMGTGAEFVVRRGFGRAIEKSAAHEILGAARARGLVQIGDNVVNRPAFICNCCGCCCEFLSGIHTFGLAAVNPSGFVANPNVDRCAGCGRCARACPIAAITTVAHRIPAERKAGLVALVDGVLCIGCGVCVDACKKGSMRMDRRAVRPDVPRDGVERTVRMAVEKGRLADLLVDAAEGSSSRVLHRIVRAIATLPVTRRVLALETVRSRFVRAAVARLARAEPAPRRRS